MLPTTGMDIHIYIKEAIILQAEVVHCTQAMKT
jgi:hypothetical protein